MSYAETKGELALRLHADERCSVAEIAEHLRMRPRAVRFLLEHGGKRPARPTATDHITRLAAVAPVAALAIGGAW